MISPEKAGLRGIRIYLAVIFSITLLTSSIFAGQDREILRAVRKGDVKKVQQFLDEGIDVNGVYNDHVLLNYAVRKEEYKISKLLINAGADVNRFFDDRSPLIEAVRSYEEPIAELLIEKGARLDLADKDGNTPLMHAVRQDEFKAVKFLMECGADQNLKNNRGKTAFEYVDRYHETPLLDYINKMKILHHNVDTLPDMFDGPHVYLKDDNRIRVEYFRHDSSLNKTWKTFRHFPVINDTVSFQGFAGDTNAYHLNLAFEKASEHVPGAPKIFTVGDVHGKIASVNKLLTIQNIIDDNGNWSFGHGHLIFTGDVFDRGSKVTEMLWFIHELKYKALKHGGDVHLLLGNHEIMAMTRDYRYLNTKYLFFSQYFFREYSSWYNEATYMGKWLRHRNVTMKIDHKLFVHAGFSPRILNQKLSLKEINTIFQLHLSGKKYSIPYIQDLLVSGDGPLWYRGYTTQKTEYTEVREALVEKTLAFYDATKLIVGHTPQYTIKPLFGHRVYAIDVPIGQEGYLAQGLLIDGDVFYKCSENGQCVKIK